MSGLNNQTGRALDGIDHLRQSIRDILTTPIGSRVMRRDYGSRLFDWIDAPLNATTRVEIYAATGDALRTWEPRFRLRRVQAEAVEAGHFSLTLEGDYLPDGQPIRLDGILV